MLGKTIAALCGTVAVIGLTTAPAAAKSSICADGFMAADMDDDGAVSESEASGSVEADFKAIDANGNGRISMSEFQKCFGEGNMQAASTRQKESDSKPASKDGNDGDAEKAAQSASAASGEDQDGMPRNAMKKPVEGAEGKPSDYPSFTDPVQAYRDEASFAETDGDEDGSIDAAEYGAAMQRAMEEIDRRAAMMSGGTDGSSDDAQAENGEMSGSEQADASDGTDDGQQMLLIRRYVLMRPADERAMQGADASGMRAQRNRMAAGTGRGFATLDRDGNGRLSPDEWMGAATQGDMRAASERRYNRMDRDSSGGVSMDEYRQRRMEAYAKAMEQAKARGMQADEKKGVPVVIYFMNQ